MKISDRVSPRLQLGILETAVIMLALVAGALTVSRASVTSWSTVAFLSLLCFFAEAFATQLPVVGAVSLSSAILLAAVLLDGPAAGAVVALLGSVSLSDIRDHKPLSRMLFNSAQYVLGTVCAGMTILALGSSPLLWSPDNSAGLRWLLVVCASATVLALSNMVLVGSAIAVYTQTSLMDVWQQSFASLSVSFLALALLGMVAAEVVFAAGIPGTLLIVIPFVIARQTFEVFRRQSRAYRETVRSLVAAIEAKDAYTKGHSERVAWYARTLAEGLLLPEDEVRSVEWAALLHDVGKVAIDVGTLTKPRSLSKDEVASVRRHPALAAQILSEIDFLADVVPLVEAHHERLDGSGYPSGLSGDSIPIGARILAVADSFDAMTSSRAYRQALPVEDALREVERGAGSLFDQRIVDQLLLSVDSQTVRGLLAQSEF